MKNALIIHGAYGNPKENWIPWLKKELEEYGYYVAVPELPTPVGQNLSSWMNVIDEMDFDFNSETVLIGHSIGATFLLSLLEKYKVNKAVFLAGFISDLTTADTDNTELDVINKTFYGKSFDWRTIRNNVELITVLHGDNDPYVDLLHAEELAAKLQSKLKITPLGGHFNKSAGFLEIPEALDEIVVSDFRKALLVPINSNGEILIQDRRGFKKPDWGFWGGGIEGKETPLEAVIREAKEELDLKLSEDDLQYAGASKLFFVGKGIAHYFVYKTDQEVFTVQEGAGAHWASFKEARNKLCGGDRRGYVLDKIKKIAHRGN